MNGERWEVSVSSLGAGWHVSPRQGMMGVENWALTLNPKRDTSFLGFFIYRQREYPKTERQLRKAVARCEEWCRRNNEAEAKAQEVLAGLIVSSDLNSRASEEVSL